MTRHQHPPLRLLLPLLGPFLLAACSGRTADRETVITFPGSMVGAEGEILRRQLDRFMVAHPGIRVEARSTPDAADQRHQLYVQWLNARTGDPDILQLDVIWAPEFAAAGWILPLNRFAPDTGAFFPAVLAADRWRDTVFALPWFVDVGMLYWRTDLMDGPPATFADLVRQASRARSHGVQYGLVWQGARYEGLVTTFLEYLGAYGGHIVENGRAVVASPAGQAALSAMRDQIFESGIVPEVALTWHEEETRFAFQNGSAAFMRNWPYAYAAMEDSASSRVAGRFAVAPMPAGPGGTPTAALGGAQLAINRHSDHPTEAWMVVDYLTQPAQMLERAQAVGQFPSRPALYDDSLLASALPVPPSVAREIINHARPRPVTPIYSELSSVLQLHLHRALTRQATPRAALAEAEREMQALLDRAGLGEADGAD